jgi:tripartite-type tricarboxylate transporter receptor subunit TctC
MRTLSIAVATVLCGALPGPAHAQGAGPVRVVIAFPPGGPVDLVARILAEGLSKELGRNVIVENRPGANGGISAQAVAKATPDGDTLWLSSAGAAVINPSLYESLTYHVQREFAPVSLVVNNVEVLVTHPSNPANSATDLVTRSKQKKDATPIASSGIGSMPHLAMELFADATKANLLHVPYKGAAPAIADVMGGQVAGFFGDVPGLLGHVKGGKLKPLGIAAPKRHPLLPQVPTLDEQGIRGVECNNWYGLFVPAKTPAARIAELNGAVRRALAADPWRSRLLESGAEPAASSPQQLAELVRADSAKWGKIVREKKIKGE